MAIQATDLTVHSVSLFERVKLMMAVALMHLWFGYDIPLWVKNTVLLMFFHNCLIKQNDANKYGHNIDSEGFFPIYL